MYVFKLISNNLVSFSFQCIEFGTCVIAPGQLQMRRLISSIIRETGKLIFGWELVPAVERWNRQAVMPALPSWESSEVADTERLKSIDGFSGRRSSEDPIDFRHFFKRRQEPTSRENKTMKEV